MRTKAKFGQILLVTMLVLVSCLVVEGNANAQTVPNEGYNAVCSLPGCTPSPSAAFVNASVFSNNGNNDICFQIRAVYNNSSGVSLVIDARGSAPATDPSSGVLYFNCSGTPWLNSNNTPIRTPSVILLPAGQIRMTEPWFIPSQTRVFGAGVDGAGPATNGATGYGTSLVCAGGTCSNLGVMVQFGGTDVHGNDYCPTTVPCTGISLEYVTVDGSGSTQASIGILNEYAQDGSYVHQVNLKNFSGSSAAGLQIGVPGGNGAVNSGPYTDLYFLNNNNGAGPPCVEIYQSGTLGLRGITCTETPTTGGSDVAIYLDASNTTIEDAHIEKFSEGIDVGAHQSAQADTLINVSGGTNLNPVVRICNDGCPGQPGGTIVSDVSIFGIASTNNSSTIAVEDMQTGISTGYNVGLYDLGTSGTSFAGGRTRFFAGATSSSSTNPIPSWGVGDQGPSGQCQSGSIYSNTSGGTGGTYTLYVCAAGGWKSII